MGYNDSLTDRIYEASVLPELWQGVLRDFAKFASSREAVVLATTDVTDFRWVSSSEAMERLVADHYTYPGSLERTRRLVALQRAGFATERDVFSEAEILAEPLYADYLIPRGYGRGIATMIHVPNGDMIVFHAEGDYRLGPAPPSLINRLDALRPHLARAALISARLAFKQARTAVETLSGIGLPACAVRKSGAVIVANQDFERETGIWTTRGNNRLAVHDRRADGQLYETLGMIGSGQRVRSIPILAQDGSPPAVLHVVPVRRAAHDLFAQAMAILVLTKASAEPTHATSLLQALFDLTPAEARIASFIAAGRTAENIAAIEGKSISTVRNQLKCVLSKAGCRRQADLVRLLTQLVPAGT